MAFNKPIILTASLLGGLAVLFGAFGAHALQLHGDALGWYETANRYHFYHALALLCLGVLPLKTHWRSSILLCWLLGVLLFSGSLYLAAINIIKWFWLTPIGGLSLLFGWGCLTVAVIKHKPSR